MIIHDDILHWTKIYSGPKFHALLTDCPYEMQFMGKGWDDSGISFQPDAWAALAEHLHPGAFLFVMAGTINDDLISVAMRQAGLRKYHRAAAWSYGSGFPKATRIDVQVDRKAGAERTKIGTRKHQSKFDAKGFEYRKKDNGFNSKDRETFDVTAPATDLAQAWAGHRYGGQMLKPALESILIFQKPYVGRPVESITRTGAGALNIEATRIEGGQEYQGTARENEHQMYGAAVFTGQGTKPGFAPSSGRWPANFALVHHPACERVGVRRVKNTAGSTNGAAARNPRGNRIYGKDDRPRGDWQAYGDDEGYETVIDWSCHPDCVVRRLGEQSGESEATRSVRVDRNTKPGYEGGWAPLAIERGHDDSGTAARFFHQSDWMAERLEEADAVGYFAKASRGEREAGLDPRQIALLEEIEELPEGRINDGRQAVSDRPYLRNQTTRRNTHPTIKPIALTRWLATLLLPPAMYAPRRLLVPFAGAGSEMVGAMLAGWEDVTGIELEADHVAIAEARLAYWQQRRWELLDPSAPITAKTDAAVAGQRDMFLEDEL